MAHEVNSVTAASQLGNLQEQSGLSLSEALKEEELNLIISRTLLFLADPSSQFEIARGVQQDMDDLRDERLGHKLPENYIPVSERIKQRPHELHLPWIGQISIAELAQQVQNTDNVSQLTPTIQVVSHNGHSSKETIELTELLVPAPAPIVESSEVKENIFPAEPIHTLGPQLTPNQRREIESEMRSQGKSTPEILIELYVNHESEYDLTDKEAFRKARAVYYADIALIKREVSEKKPKVNRRRKVVEQPSPPVPESKIESSDEEGLSNENSSSEELDPLAEPTNDVELEAQVETAVDPWYFDDEEYAAINRIMKNGYLDDAIRKVVYLKAKMTTEELGLFDKITADYEQKHLQKSPEEQKKLEIKVWDRLLDLAEMHYSEFVDLARTDQVDFRLFIALREIHTIRSDVIYSRAFRPIRG